MALLVGDISAEYASCDAFEHVSGITIQEVLRASINTYFIFFDLICKFVTQLLPRTGTNIDQSKTSSHLKCCSIMLRSCIVPDRKKCSIKE